ncbi:hypothetical protein ANO14919_107460 [Xylariales sp. No.14919]|nr:hypothetical protein ANO14919_107460 [Xylariales sp. No.14919]
MPRVRKVHADENVNDLKDGSREPTDTTFSALVLSLE